MGTPRLTISSPSLRLAFGPFCFHEWILYISQVLLLCSSFLRVYPSSNPLSSPPFPILALSLSKHLVAKLAFLLSPQVPKTTPLNRALSHTLRFIGGDAVGSSRSLLPYSPSFLRSCTGPVSIIVLTLLALHPSPQVLGSPMAILAFLLLPCALPLYSYMTPLPPSPECVYNAPPLLSVRHEVRQAPPLPRACGAGSAATCSCPDAPPERFPEAYASVVRENRLKLLSKSALFRTFEAYFTIVVMPSLPSVSEYLTQPASMGYWYYALSLSSSVVTCSLLLSQSVSLSRSPLTSVALVTGEWSRKPNHTGPNPQPWDPKKTYKKGDLISERNIISDVRHVYVSQSDSPESRPRDVFLRANFDLFFSEFGPLHTSSTVSTVAKLHMLHATAMVFAGFYAGWAGIAAGAANLVAAVAWGGGDSRIEPPFGTPEMSNGKVGEK